MEDLTNALSAESIHHTQMVRTPSAAGAALSMRLGAKSIDGALGATSAAGE